MSIKKILLFGLLVVIISIPLWMVTGLIVNPTGLENPLNYIPLLPCYIVSLFFASRSKFISIQSALRQGIIWAVMIGIVVFTLDIRFEGLEGLLQHPWIYLIPAAVFAGPITIHFLRAFRK